MDGVEARPRQHVVHVVRELALVVDLGRARRDLVLGEVTHRAAERIVLVGEPVQVEVRVPATHTPK